MTEDFMKGIGFSSRLNKIATLIGKIVLTLSFLGLWSCQSQSYSNMYTLYPADPKYGYRVNDNNYLNQCIGDILCQTHSQVKDLDKNGKIECIDYSVTFHVLWHKKYARVAACNLTINRNPSTGMNHMFITIKTDKEYHIEPQYYDWFYIMETVWGNKYDSKYDIYTPHHFWYVECHIS